MQITRGLVASSVCACTLLSRAAEAAELLTALADLTVGAGLIEDISSSLTGAELPSMMDIGDSLTGLAGFDAQMLPQLSQEQKQHIELAESFLSPFAYPFADVQGIPQLFSRSSSSSSSSNTTSSSTASTNTSSSSSSSSKPHTSITTTSSNSSSSYGRGSNGARYSLRGSPLPFDPAEFEKLAETIAEGVANSTVFGFRNNPFAQAAAAAAAAAKAAAERGEDAPSPTAAALAVLSRLNPLTLLQLHQMYEKHRMEQQKLQQQQQQQQESPEQQQEEAQAAISTLEEAPERRAAAAAAAAAGAAPAAAPAGEVPQRASEQPEDMSPDAAAAAAAAAGGEEESREVQRWMSRVNPFGPLQQWADTWGLMHWSIKNPIALLQWKSYAYALCMEVYRDEELCAKQLKTEVTAANHGGTNNPWRPSQSP